MISSFILSYPFDTLFIKTNSSWLIFESIKALGIKTFMIFNLTFASTAISSRAFFIFFWLLTYKFLIPAVIAQTFSAIAELAVLTRIPSKDAKAEIEVHSLTVVAKMRKCST